ncbi:MAG: hypothetical protein BRD50_00785 [Bacteroidetes bacterium SW_11_45_7]|nr:MAG: hypothetical protein BRD50_00785 [Bacteroidetes bacterium SW_11_45_7]
MRFPHRGLGGETGWRTAAAPEQGDIQPFGFKCQPEGLGEVTALLQQGIVGIRPRVDRAVPGKGISGLLIPMHGGPHSVCHQLREVFVNVIPASSADP